MRQVSVVSATSYAKSATSAEPGATVGSVAASVPGPVLGGIGGFGGGSAGGLAAGGAALLPRLDLGLDVAGRGDDRRSAGELAAGVDDAGVEVRHDPAYAVRARLAVQDRVELGVLLAQPDRG